MNKSDLIEAVAQDAEISKAAAARAIDAVVDNITKAVAAGDGVALVGFGSFRPQARAERTGKNPKTGEKLTIAARVVPRFTAGATFRTKVNAATLKKQAKKAAGKK